MAEKEIKVSIVIPICNTGRYLRDTLGSVVAQTLKEIEIICVDDFSVDNCREIIQEFQSKDNRIKAIYHTTNLSTSQARKDGALAAQGKYIMFLDGDDELVPTACEIAFEAIERAGTDIVHFGTEIVNCAGVPEARIQSNERMVAPLLGRLESDCLLYDCFRDKRFGFQIWNKIYRGELVRQSFAQVEDGSFPKAQDLYAVFLMTYGAKTYFGIEDKLYKYKFGLGVTGGNFITLNKYKTMLTEKWVTDALKRFAKDKADREALEKVVTTIYRGFLNECFCRWRDNLNYKDRDEGFKLFCDTFTFEEVLGYMAEKNWNNRVEISKLLLNNPYFQYVPRVDKVKKTVAMYYRCISNGGAQRVVSLLCNSWAAMKDETGQPLYEVVLITDEGPQEKEYPLSPEVKRAYLPDFSTSEAEAYRERLTGWQSIIDAFKVDMVITGMGLSACTFWDLLAVKGHPSKPAFCIHSHTCCGYPYSLNNSDAIELTYKYRLCDGAITLSDCDKLYVEGFNSYVECIANPLTYKLEETPISSYEDNYVLWCGRIAPEKQPLDLVKAMELVVKELPQAKLHIVGEGAPELVEKLQQEAVQRGVADNIIFEGFSSEVDSFYSRASLMLVTSEFEGFSMTIAEAFVHQVPVISYDMPYLSFMKDGRGLVTIPQGDYARLADAIVGLLKDKAKIKALGLAGKENVRSLCGAEINIRWNRFLQGMDQKSLSKGAVEDKTLVIDQITRFHEKSRFNNISYTNRTKRRIAFLEDNRAKLKDKVSELSARLYEKDAQIRIFREEKAGLFERVKSKDTAIKELRDRLTGLTEKVSVRDASIKDLRAKGAELFERVKTKDAAIKELRAKSVESSKQIAGLQGEVKNLKAGLAKEQEKLQKQTAVNADLKQQLEELKLELAELNEAKQGLERTQQGLKRTQQRLEKELQATKKHVKDMEQGMSMKVGRIITWIPRKVTGRKW